MKLLTTLVSSIAVVFLAGCVPAPQPMYIERFLPLEAGCVLSGGKADGVSASGGALDIAPGDPAFQLGVRVLGGDLYRAEKVQLATGQILEAENRNRPIIDRVVVSYSAKPTSLGLQLPSAQFLRSEPLVDGEAVILPINVITPEVAQSLMDKVGVGDEVELSVSVEVRGYMSGDRSVVTTGALVFPIRVFMSDQSACANVRKPDPVTCVYPGQSTSAAPEVCCDKLLAGTLGCP